MSQPLLQIENLKTWFHTEDAVVRAVDGVSLELAEGSDPRWSWANRAPASR